MDELAVGDSVQVSSGVYSKVFAFSHRLPAAVSTFVHLKMSSGAELMATPGHYIYANDGLLAAGAVRPGDIVHLASGEVSRVSSVRQEKSMGLFNPQTLHGDIVVDGVRASTYTTAVEPEFAHASLSVLRCSYSWFGTAWSFLESGVEKVAARLPSGPMAL